MTRFRLSGVNWEGREWWAAAPIGALAEQIREVWPDSHPADGTVASKSHDQTNPSSDHRPKPTTGRGVVRALDMGELVEGQGELLAEQLLSSRDPRIRYVIHEGALFSSYDHADGPAWRWRLYRGGNQHLDHVHVSTLAAADTFSPRFAINLQGEDIMTPAQEAKLDAVLEAVGAIDDIVDEVWGRVWHEEGIGAEPTPDDITALQAVVRGFKIARAILALIGVADDIDPINVATLIVDALDDSLATAVADLIAARLVE